MQDWSGNKKAVFVTNGDYGMNTRTGKSKRILMIFRQR